MSSETKKKRSPNFTESEIELFVEVLLPKYKSVIENKKTDALTRGEKAAAWSRLQVDFNNLSSIFHRTEENLRNLWGELKKKARKRQAFQKRETVCTGGGERNKSGDPTKLDDKVLEVIGPSGVGLNEQYGGDAEIPETDSSSALNTIGDLFVVGTSDTLQTAETATIELLDCSGIVVPQQNWSDVVPRHLYSKKPQALKMVDGSTPSTSGTQMSNSSTPTTSAESARKRTVAEELEYAKIMKRRRPSLSTAPPPDENQAKLVAARLDLALATKANMEEQKKRDEELFQIEKRRKESEAVLVELQVLKMKKELGLDK